MSNEMQNIDLKSTLAAKAGEADTKSSASKKCKKTMLDVVEAMMPEIKRALPKVITPERFVRLAVSALNTTPGLHQCTPVTFVAALMNAAQLGLEPNTPLGQAYLIPYRNNKKETIECQFQIGYKGLIELAYRTGEMRTIQAHAVYEGDYFDYQYGFDAKLVHRPALTNRGKQICFYGLFRTVNGGYGMSVMGKDEMDVYARSYSKSFDSQYSVWRTNYDDMAKKTVIKQALKYAPVKSELQRALVCDESIKVDISDDMLDVSNQMLVTEGEAA